MCMQSTLLFSSNLKWKAFSKQPQRTCSCIHWYLTSLLLKVYAKGCSKLTQAYNKVHAYSTVVPYSGTCTCKWLCVWHWAGSRSPQRLFCTKIHTKLSVHRISVIKTRQSLTTEIVNSSFYCTCRSHLHLISSSVSCIRRYGILKALIKRPFIIYYMSIHFIQIVSCDSILTIIPSNTVFKCNMLFHSVCVEQSPWLLLPVYFCKLFWSA